MCSPEHRVKLMGMYLCLVLQEGEPESICAALLYSVGEVCLLTLRCLGNFFLV